MRISDYQIGKNHGLELAQVYIDAILRYSDNEEKNIIRVLTRMRYYLETIKTINNEEEQSDTISVH